MEILKKHYLIVKKKQRERNARYYTSRGRTETLMCKLEDMMEEGGAAESYNFSGIDKTDNKDFWSTIEKEHTKWRNLLD